jgi:hypothetical protein
MRPPRVHLLQDYFLEESSRVVAVVVVVNDCFEIFTTASFVSYFIPRSGRALLDFSP